MDDEDGDRAEALLAWLAEQGYVQAVGVVDPRPGGNRTTRMLRGGCQVTVSRDRGQWFVEAGPIGCDGFDMSLWEAYLRGLQPAVEPPAFADEDRLVRSVLHEIERTLVLDDDALPRLEGLEELRNQARWDWRQHAY